MDVHCGVARFGFDRSTTDPFNLQMLFKDIDGSLREPHLSRLGGSYASIP